MLSMACNDTIVAKRDLHVEGQLVWSKDDDCLPLRLPTSDSGYHLQARAPIRTANQYELWWYRFPKVGKDHQQTIKFTDPKVIVRKVRPTPMHLSFYGCALLADHTSISIKTGFLCSSASQVYLVQLTLIKGGAGLTRDSDRKDGRW